MRKRVGFAVTVFVLVFACCLPALAALGSDVASVENDRAMMKGTLARHAVKGYTVHEIKTASVTVHEYVSADGIVFGVSWHGQFAPDLQQLLGGYFDQYSSGVKAQKATYVGRRPLNLRLDDLIVERRGHMRSESGRAYIPSKLPFGVNVEELW